MKVSKSKVISIFLIIFIILELSSCKSINKNKKKEQKQSITYNLTSEPQSLDPAFNYSIEANNVIENVFEGLTRLGDKDKIENGVAEKWNISQEYTNYTFFIRKNAKWSDGKEVTANDFEYQWKRILNPATGSKYAYKLYCIKNGEDYNKGKVSEDKVGVKAVDKYTLNVLLQNPNSKFLAITASQTFMPFRKDMVESKIDNNISNGPFVINSWQKDKNMTFKKNKNYWDKKNVKLESLKFTFEKDPKKYYKSYKEGKIDVIDFPPSSDTDKLIKNGEEKEYQVEGIGYINVNLEKVPDSKLRRAISLGINRNIILNKISSGTGKAAVSLIPLDIKDNNGKTFSKAYYSNDGDIKQAKALLNESTQGSSVPELDLLYIEEGNNNIIAKTIKDMLKKNLNIDVKLSGYDSKKFNEEVGKKNYSLALEDIVSDYSDPMIFLDAFITGRGENTSGYSNPKYDSLVEEAKTKNTENSKYDEMEKAESVLMEDMPIIPIYQLSITRCEKNYIKGLTTDKFGIIDFKKARIEKG